MRGSIPAFAAAATAGLMCPPAPSRAADPPAEYDRPAAAAVPALSGRHAPPPAAPWTGPLDTGVLYNNGPFVTAPTVNPGSICAGDQSLLQNATLCLNILGFTAQFEGATDINLADDFTLACPMSEVTAVTVFAYETGAVLPTIVGGDLRIHGAPPVTPLVPPPIAATAVLAGPATFTPTYRQTEAGAGMLLCTRHVSALTFTFAPPVLLPAGTYWISYRLTGGGDAGPFVPPVTVIGMTGKPGANGLQYTVAAGAFAPVTDAGVAGCLPPPPAPNPQDFPFLVYGHSTCYPDCDHSCTLTVADFGCFQTNFVIHDPYGDCNGDGAWTVADFGCFQTRFVLGCP